MPSRIHLDRAVRTMLAGGVVAYPTEAVWGLGCLALEHAAVLRILALKRRSWRMGLILIASDFEQLAPFVTLPEGDRGQTILASWPGPNSWVLPARPWIPDWLTGGRPTLAVRVTAHATARGLCERAGQALVSTSANVSGRPPLKRPWRVHREFGRDVDYILPGALGDSPQPTTLRDGSTGRVLRP